jgi:hypothetical protein
MDTDGKGDITIVFEETREISINIPVLYDHFSDDKEITELFTYVFELCQLWENRHPYMGFKVGYEFGKRVSKFTMTVRSDCEDYDVIKNEMEMLANDYHRYEIEYLRFKRFGNIESGALMRRKH